MARSCTKCGGKGRIKNFRHTDNGICYRCNGTGVDPRYKGKKKVNKYLFMGMGHFINSGRLIVNQHTGDTALVTKSAEQA